MRRTRISLKTWSRESLMKAMSVLGVTEQTTLDATKRMYRRASMKHHPDRGGDREKFENLRESYELVLKFKENYIEIDNCDEDAFIQNLENAVSAQNTEAFDALQISLLTDKNLLHSLKSVYLLIEGSLLILPVGMEQTLFCMRVIEAYESRTKQTVNVDVFNAVIYPYAFLKRNDPLEDGVMVTRCVTLICEEMQHRHIDIESEWWTKRLVDKALKSSGKFSQPEIVEMNAPTVASWRDAKSKMQTGDERTSSA